MQCLCCYRPGFSWRYCSVVSCYSSGFRYYYVVSLLLQTWLQLEILQCGVLLQLWLQILLCSIFVATDLASAGDITVQYLSCYKSGCSWIYYCVVSLLLQIWLQLEILLCSVCALLLLQSQLQSGIQQNCCCLCCYRSGFSWRYYSVVCVRFCCCRASCSQGYNRTVVVFAATDRWPHTAPKYYNVLASAFSAYRTHRQPYNSQSSAVSFCNRHARDRIVFADADLTALRDIPM